jgi:ubiquitin-conjugating enzyme E2 S
MNGYSSNQLSAIVTQKILKELRELANKPLEDVQVHVKGDNIRSIEATIIGPTGTPYDGGEYTIRLVFGADFPNVPPKGYFLTKIFHPNVASETGEICVNTLKRDWKSDYGLKKILVAVRSLLIVPNPDSALNEEAGKLLLQSYDDFAKRAKIFAQIHAKSVGHLHKSEEEEEDDNIDLTQEDEEPDEDDANESNTNENEESSNKPCKSKEKEDQQDNKDKQSVVENKNSKSLKAKVPPDKLKASKSKISKSLRRL